MKNNHQNIKAFESILVFMFSLSLLFIAQNMINTQLHIWPAVAASLFMGIFSYIIESKTLLNKSRLYAVYGLLFLLILVLIFFVNPVKTGFLYFLNQILIYMGKCTGNYIHLFDVVGQSNLFLFILGFLTWFTGKIVVEIKSRSLLIILFIMFIITLGVGIELNPLAGGFYVLVLFLIYVWLYFFCESKREKVYFDGKAVGGWLLMASIVFMMTTATITYLVPPLNFERDKGLGKVKNAITTTYDRLRFGNNVLPEGDFSKMDKMQRTDETAIEVVMSDPQSMFLRGFVGSEYTSSGWETQPADIYYDHYGLFYWLHQDNFTPLKQLDQARRIVQGDNSEPINVKVNLKNACRKYAYAPYELISMEGKNQVQSKADETMLSKGAGGQKYYNFSTGNSIMKDYLQIAQTYLEEHSQNDTTYENDEAHYNQYVYDTYTALSDKDKLLLQSHFGEFETQGNHAPYTVAKNKILSYLSQNITYQENPGKCPAGREFLQFILEDSASGYDVHYATAATLMFRYYGIPARYVEGYLVTLDDVKDKEGYSVIPLPEKNAHAWVEIYQDGLGWVPVEVTPSYLDKTEQPSDIVIAQKQEPNIISTSYQESNVTQIESPEQQEEIKKREKDKRLLQIIISIVVASILLILLFLFARTIYRLYKHRKEKLAMFNDGDRKIAIRSLFIDTMNLLYYDGIPKMGGSMYKQSKNLSEKYGETYGEQYEKTLDNTQKAIFSDLKPEEREYNQVYEFMNNIRNTIIKNKSLYEKAVMFFKGI
jgi:hypothetical protein